MKRTAIVSVLIMAVLPCVASAGMVNFQEDFNWSDDLADSSDWSDPDGVYYVDGAVARGRSHGGVALVNNYSVSATDESFSVSVDLNKAGSSSYWAGLVFGAQDSTDYITARVRTDGAYMVYGGGMDMLTGQAPAALAATPSFTHLEVTRSESGNYAFLFNGNILTTWTDEDMPAQYNAGQVGIYTSGSSTWFFRFDNFELNTVPEPATLGLLTAGGLALIRRRRR